MVSCTDRDNVFIALNLECTMLENDNNITGDKCENTYGYNTAEK